MFLLAGVPDTLRGVVRRIAAYDERSSTPLRRRQAPVPTVTLVVGLGEPLRIDGTAVGSFVAGPGDAAAVTEFRGHQAGVQIDLTPPGGMRLLGMPLRHVGPVRPLDDLHPLLATLPGRLAALPTWAARLEAVRATLVGVLAAGAASADPEVERAWWLLAVRAGRRIPLDALARDVGWSRRHLTRRFSDQIGLAPTTVARVLRFRRAADLLVPPPGNVPGTASRIADVAAACGYADHSHLDREFRVLAGCSPGRYVRDWATVTVDPQEVRRLDDGPRAQPGRTGR